MIRTGAMTSTFIKAVLRGHRATYGSILNSMRSEIHHMSNNETVDGRSSLLAMLRIGVNRQVASVFSSVLSLKFEIVFPVTIRRRKLRYYDYLSSKILGVLLFPNYPSFWVYRDVLTLFNCV